MTWLEEGPFGYRTNLLVRGRQVFAPPAKLTGDWEEGVGGRVEGGDGGLSSVKKSLV